MQRHSGIRVAGTVARAAALLALLACAVGCKPAPPPPMARAVDPCGLLSPQRAAALLGVKEVRMGGYGSPGGGARGCAWDSVEGVRGADLTVNVALAPPHDDRMQKMFTGNREGIQKLGDAPDTVSGLGDEAFWQSSPGVLHVRSGTCYFTLSLGGSARTGARAMATRLASELLVAACQPEPEPQAPPATPGT